MAAGAAELVDHTLPYVPIPQWVLSLPHGLRYRLAWDHSADALRAALVRMATRLPTFLLWTTLVGLARSRKHHQGRAHPHRTSRRRDRHDRARKEVEVRPRISGIVELPP